MMSHEAPRYSALIADDEPVARDVIDVLLREFESVEICGHASDGEEALSMIRQYQPDIVFLDIHMPLMNGIKVAENIDIETPPYIVFTTAYDEYALQAFDLNALDYLLKPFNKLRFHEAVKRCLVALEQRESLDFKSQVLRFNRDYKSLVEGQFDDSEKKPRYSDRITIRDSKRIVFVRVESIVAINASGDYIEICYNETKQLLYKSLNEIEAVLDPNSFRRIHRSHIINVDKILEIRPHQNGEYYFHMGEGLVIKSSRSYKVTVMALL